MGLSEVRGNEQAEVSSVPASSDKASGRSHDCGSVPKVSVVIATHNRPEMLSEAIESVRYQLGGDIEVLVVDDDSDPELAARNRGIVEQVPCADYIRNKRCLGPGASRNRAITLAKGRYVAILDDDDIALPERLQKQVAMLEQNSDVDVIVGLAEWINEAGDVFDTWPGVIRESRWPKSAVDVFRLLLLQSNKIPNSTVMARSEVLKQNQYASDIRVGEDWLLWLQLSSIGVAFKADQMGATQMRRGVDHKSLMKTDVASIHQCQRQVLVRARFWTQQRGIPVTRATWRAAWSNQYAREAQQVSGLAAISRSLRSVSAAPLQPEGWRSLGRLLFRGAKRGVRAAVGERSGLA